MTKGSEKLSSVGSTSTSYRAFGVAVTLEHGDDPVEASRQLARLARDCEPFLASRALPRSGVCVDVGAGDGWFAIPFAKAFPDWQVLCFEADEAAARRLRANAARHRLDNVICVAAALHPESRVRIQPREPGGEGLAAWAARLEGAAARAEFRRLRALGGRLVPLRAGEKGVAVPALPPAVLAMAGPDLVRLDAPGCEGAVADALKDCPVGFIHGRLYRHVPSHRFNPSATAAPREYYLRLDDEIVLRRDFEDNFETRRQRLDVVVAMYNTRSYIRECVDSLLADGNPEIRVLVVDDGSTDGSAELVTELYGKNRRVKLLRKANGGCASARNHGRRNSDASHIAFIDADDRVDPGMFTALLEVARHTGAFVVEGEFQFLHVDEDGGERLEPSYESEIHSVPGDRALGPYDFIWIPGPDLAIGQPTIWRRVHRRDFLDRNGIWFPEHVRAFDDQIFQLMVAHYAGSVAHVRGHAYHYRQHPAQDIKQGDERHFYSFNMFRALFLRALEENWPNIDPYVQSLLNTMRWSYGGLRADLKTTYQKAAAEFLAILERTYGFELPDFRLQHTGIEGIDILLQHRRREMAQVPVNYGLMRLENWRWQPEFIRMMQAVRDRAGKD